MGETIEGTARIMVEMASPYGLGPVGDWRWVKEDESPAIAMLRAGGRRYVARLFSGEDALPRAAYISELALHLGSAGVVVEEVVRTASGEPFASPPSGMPMILSHFHPDSPLPVPFDADVARSWGRYVAVMHAACRDWCPPAPLPSPWLRDDPGTVLGRALGLARSTPSFRAMLEDASERIIRCWEGAPATQPVHGDLWPGNLLGGRQGLRAIDFAEAGEGPRTIDLATAFRWMPWRDNPAGAARSWEAWLAGYTEVGTLSQAELDAVPQVACLQHLIWMVAEVGASPGGAESSWYIEDHCSAVQALLAAS